jgi:hypothetical protein
MFILKYSSCNACLGVPKPNYNPIEHAFSRSILVYFPSQVLDGAQGNILRVYPYTTAMMGTVYRLVVMSSQAYAHRPEL